MRGKARHEPEPCKEQDYCGSLVVDRIAHRDWHERVFIQAKEAAQAAPVARGPRYLGEPDPIETQTPGGPATPQGGTP